MRSVPGRFPLALACLVLAIVHSSNASRAEDPEKPAAKPVPKTPAAKTPAAKTPAAKPAAKDDTDEVILKWRSLVKRRDEISVQLNSMQQAFQITDAKGKKDLGLKSEKLMQEFISDVNPSLMKLAPQVLKLEPKNLVAAEAVAAQLFDENKYPELIALGEQMLNDESNSKSAVLLNTIGVAYYAMADFERAQVLLERAQKFDKQLFPEVGAKYLPACPPYPEFWRIEQEIRAKEAEADDLPRVLFKTTRGDIVLELFENEAPNTVANFIYLVENKKYDGTVFHRVIPNFMAQGGDPNTLDDDPMNDGQGGPGYTIACECYRKDARRHFRGSLSMAHAGKDTGGSQFFITHLPTMMLNGNAAEKRGHTVFGRVVDGLDVAAALRIGDKIETATVLRKRDHDYVPVKVGAKAATKPAPEKKSEE